MADKDNERGLFEIRAVCKDTEKVVFKEEVVAEGEKEALFESGLKEGLKKEKIDKDDVYILVREFGTLPAKEDIKRVKIIGKVGKCILGTEQKK